MTGQGEICRYGVADEDIDAVEEEAVQHIPQRQLEHEAGIHGYSLSMLVVGIAK